MKGAKNDKTKRRVGLTAVIFSIMGIILISYVFQNSYADPPALRTLRIKVQLDKSVIARGDTQTVHFSVVDAKSRIPIGGSITRATVTYPAGTPVRQFSTITDKSGHSSISWQIEDKAPLGSYAIRYDVFEQGYAEEGFGSNFAVVAHSVYHNYHHHDHSNYPHHY